jgi:hypothetical protein
MSYFKIPYHLFLFLWSSCGVFILGYTFVFDIIHQTTVISRKLLIELIWFAVFLMYMIFFIKHKLKSGN